MSADRPYRVGIVLGTVLSLLSSGALASQSARDHHRAVAETGQQNHWAMRHDHHLASREPARLRHPRSAVGYPSGPVHTPGYAAGASAAGGHAAGAYAGPGYVFVPGHGILGEDCNMPTSTCPNDVRDVQ